MEKQISIYCKIEACKAKMVKSYASLIKDYGKEILVPCPKCKTGNLYLINTDLLFKNQNRIISKNENKTLTFSAAEKWIIHKSMMKVIISQTDKTEEQIIMLQEGQNIIGRNNIKTNDTSISREHCVINVQKDDIGYKITIKDQKSTNGTFINERKLLGNDEFYLTIEDEVKLNKTKCRLVP